MNETTDKNKDANTIRSARIHEYQKPLSIDNTPRISTGEQVLVKVAAGLCHSD
jgi:D-arabinose 1-dehydrogenase-like Zn-dependent alcohol dehydrogenase